MSVAIGSGRGGRGALPLVLTYSGARIYSYTNLTIPGEVKEAIVKKFRDGWFEPRARPGQRTFEHGCTRWRPYEGIAAEVARDLEAPCDIKVARTGPHGETIAGFLLWGAHGEDAFLIHWVVSDVPGLGAFMVNGVIRRVQQEVDRTRQEAVVMVVSPGYKIAANALECAANPAFSADQYWMSQGFLLDDRLSGRDFYKWLRPG